MCPPITPICHQRLAGPEGRRPLEGRPEVPMNALASTFLSRLGPLRPRQSSDGSQMQIGRLMIQYAPGDCLLPSDGRHPLMLAADELIKTVNVS